MRRLLGLFLFLPCIGYADSVMVRFCTSTGGVTTVLREEILVAGNAYETATPPTFDGHVFTHWISSAESGFASRDALGRALDTPRFVVERGLTLTAHYVPASDDTDRDGLRDGDEYYWYGDLSKTPTSDTDGDGVNFAHELANGTNPLMAEADIAGPVQISTGELVTYSATVCPFLTVRSEPDGVLVTTSQDLCRSGTKVTTASFSPATSTFAYWRKNGVVQRDAFGRALDSVSFTMGEEDIELVAVSVADETARHQLYWYGGTDVALTSDTDGDGVDFAHEIANGTNPLMAEADIAGPIQISTGELVTYSATVCPVVTVRSEPDGALVTTSQDLCRSGTKVTTASFSPATSTFAYWRKNGVVQRDAFGRALDCVSFTMGEEDIELVAVSVADETARHQLYWYGGTDVALTSDTDGDGVDFAHEIANETNPLMAEADIAGPIQIATGAEIVYDANQGPTRGDEIVVEMRRTDLEEPFSVLELSFGKVYRLPSCMATPPAGKTRFAGWACSNGKRYDDGVLVFNLAEPGETVTMTAIWE